jgi:RND family efflux transporter MFP subunit
VIGERLVEPGDLAVPGKPLVTIYDPRAIRVELRVPEDMIRLVQVGSAIKVHVDATGQDLEGVVSEVVPEADPASRTFLVRAPLPLADSLRPGMFARAAFKVGDRRLLTVARAAIGDVGQLETVRVVTDGGVQLRQIATGRRYGERVEVLSGLNADDRVLLDRQSTRTHE